MSERVRVFSNGTEYDWFLGQNCEGCTKSGEIYGEAYSPCSILAALQDASIDDGTIPAAIAARKGAGPRCLEYEETEERAAARRQWERDEASGVNLVRQLERHLRYIKGQFDDMASYLEDAYKEQQETLAATLPPDADPWETVPSVELLMVSLARTYARPKWQAIAPLLTAILGKLEAAS